MQLVDAFDGEVVEMQSQLAVWIPIQLSFRNQRKRQSASDSDPRQILIHGKNLAPNVRERSRNCHQFPLDDLRRNSNAIDKRRVG